MRGLLHRLLLYVTHLFSALALSSIPRKVVFREYSPIPLIGKYLVGDALTDAVFLGKTNLKIVDIADDEENKSGGLVDVFERRVARDVVPVPITRTDINAAILNLFSDMKQQTSASMSFSGGAGAVSMRDGGVFDNIRFLLSQGVELGNEDLVRAILGSSPSIPTSSFSMLASTAIMKALNKNMANSQDSNPYVIFLSSLYEVLGLRVQGLLIEVADRPNTGSIYIGGAVLVGAESICVTKGGVAGEEGGIIDDDFDGEWSSQNALDIIKKVQSGSTSSRFLNCHSDEVIGENI